jgi:ribosomal protein L37AE/L43A
VSDIDYRVCPACQERKLRIQGDTYHCEACEFTFTGPELRRVETEWIEERAHEHRLERERRK